MSTAKTSEALDLLTEIGQEMIRQDKHGTAFPVYEVWQEERVYGVDEEWHRIAGWIESDDNGEYRDIEWDDTANAWRAVDPEDDEPVGDHVYPYAVEKRPVDAGIALTMRAAEQYIGRYNHNLCKPFVRVGSMHAVPEMRAVYDALVVLGSV